jgi:outer membrane protein insertion porin family
MELLSYNLKVICIDICFRILEAGSSYPNFKAYNPFDLSRSAGVGLRVFMPAFGLLGIDFGHGFDALPGQINRMDGWKPISLLDNNLKKFNHDFLIL